MVSIAAYMEINWLVSRGRKLDTLLHYGDKGQMKAILSNTQYLRILSFWTNFNTPFNVVETNDAYNALDIYSLNVMI